MTDIRKSNASPSPWRGSRFWLALAACLCLAFGLACGGLHKAGQAYAEARYDDALAEYNKVLDKSPASLEARIGYQRTAPLAAAQHLAKAESARNHGDTDLETKEVGTAVLLDPSNAHAQEWLRRLEAAAERARAQAASENLDAVRAQGESRNGLPINPRSLAGMDLNFTRRTSLREILMQLSRTSGVNILLHASATAQDVTVSVDLRGLTFQKVLDALMLQSDMFYKVIDPNTIMVFKKTPQNLSEYENKLIQTFYLSNAEVENVRQIFSAILPQVRAFSDKRLNALTVLAKASDLVVAKRIVNQLDKAKAEVMIYMELLEVSERTAENLGLLPVLSPLATAGTYSVGLTASGAGGLNQQAGSRISKSALNYLYPSLRLDLAKSTGLTKLLANPNVRVVSGESGMVNISDKVSTTQSSIGLPNPGSSTPSSAGATGAAALGGTLATQTTYGYEDVGVKITVKPRVHFNGDITIDLESTITTLRAGSSDPGRPEISQRVIKTVARLKNGETAIFAGLLKEDERKNLQGIWGLSSIPVVSDLLGHRDDVDTKTDVILSIKAVVVRTADLQGEDFEPFDPDQAPNRAKPFTPAAGKDLGEAPGPRPVLSAPGAAAPASRPAPPAPSAAAPAPVDPGLADDEDD